MELASKDWKQCICDGANALGIHIDKLAADQFAVHATELSIWSRKINLTNIKDPLEIAIKHFLDSIAPVQMIPGGASVLDIGSGAGFPGIPLKVMMPSSPVTLVDASRKKVNFIKHIIRTLQLQNTEAYQVRAEEIKRAWPKSFQEQRPDAHGFDVIVCRALSALDNFVRMALPLLAERGMLIALKGKITKAELDSVKSIKRESREMTNPEQEKFSLTLKRYTLPYLNAERSIVCLNFSKVIPNKL